MLRRLVWFLVAVVVLTLIPGCDSHRIPLGKKGEQPLDARLLGSWRYEQSAVVIWPEDGQYKIVLNPGTSAENIYLAYPSLVAGRVFLNMTVVKCPLIPEDPSRFYFATYECEGNRLILKFVNQDVVPYSLNSTAKLRAAVEVAMAQDNLRDGKPMVLTRVRGNRSRVQPFKKAAH